MASKFATVKLNSRLVEEARREADLFHRSLGSQIEHWAQIGRAFENAEGNSATRVRAALEGRFKLDDLTATEQDAFFDELGSVFEAPGSDVAASYAKLGDERAAARTARQAHSKARDRNRRRKPTP